MKQAFSKILNSYLDINQILLSKNTKETNEYKLLLSKINGPYYDIALPKNETLELKSIKEIEDFYSESDTRFTFYLLENHRKSGLMSTLVNNGYKFYDMEAWMVLDSDSSLDFDASIKIADVNSENAEDYKKVLNEVSADYDGNEVYQEIIANSVGSVENNVVPDLESLAYVIYEDNEAVSAGSLVHSVDADFAYLHNSGTLDKARNKGNQTALIKHRVETAKSLEISNIFTIVDVGSQSWSNMIKNGFYQEHVGYFLIK